MPSDVEARDAELNPQAGGERSRRSTGNTARRSRAIRMLIDSGRLFACRRAPTREKEERSNEERESQKKGRV